MVLRIGSVLGHLGYPPAFTKLGYTVLAHPADKQIQVRASQILMILAIADLLIATPMAGWLRPLGQTTHSNGKSFRGHRSICRKDQTLIRHPNGDRVKRCESGFDPNKTALNESCHPAETMEKRGPMKPTTVILLLNCRGEGGYLPAFESQTYRTPGMLQMDEISDK